MQSSPIVNLIANLWLNWLISNLRLNRWQTYSQYNTKPIFKSIWNLWCSVYQRIDRTLKDFVYKTFLFFFWDVVPWNVCLVRRQWKQRGVKNTLWPHLITPDDVTAGWRQQCRPIQAGKAYGESFVFKDEVAEVLRASHCSRCERGVIVMTRTLGALL